MDEIRLRSSSFFRKKKERKKERNRGILSKCKKRGGTQIPINYVVIIKLSEIEISNGTRGIRATLKFLDRGFLSTGVSVGKARSGKRYWPFLGESMRVSSISR